MSEPTRNESGDGRVVVIVGASSGIGRAVALRCAGRGDTLVLAARREELLRRLADEVAALQPGGAGKTATVTADVRDSGAAAGIVDAALSHFGRLDVVVYAAGWNVRNRSIYETTDESWQSIVETNVTGAFSVTRAAVPAMEARGGGLLVYVSSSGAKRPDQSGVAYQASKAGMAALAHATMEEARAAGIRTTVIYPGLTDTPFLEHRPVPPDEETLRRALQPEDVAAACGFVMDLPARAHVPELLLYPSRT
ncbi:MAG TPA: SDR family oxidoreductase [Streptosporangiaceae bacterium]|jgi:NADP-dependent 3-hydroxy acid dehydrogenase YdfG|nr:SDR family oxidoreductase [Streptosporangiaceae bacterium]